MRRGRSGDGQRDSLSFGGSCAYHFVSDVLQSPSAFVGVCRLLDHARPSVAHLAPAPQ